MIIGSATVEVGGLRLRHGLIQRGELEQLKRHRDIGDAEIDMAAETVTPAALQCAEDGDDRKQAAGHVRDRRIEAAWRHAVAM